MQLKKVVARNITRIRTTNGLSKVQLGNKAKPVLHASQITRIESGTSNLSLDLIERLAKALGVSPNILLAPSSDEDLEPLAQSTLDFALKQLKSSVELLESLKK